MRLLLGDRVGSDRPDRDSRGDAGDEGIAEAHQSYRFGSLVATELDVEAGPDEQDSAAEYRSRNNLIQLLLTQAVQRRQKILQEASMPDTAAAASQVTSNTAVSMEEKYR